jgi:nicotinate-nucleotide adenylyltransferase
MKVGLMGGTFDPLHFGHLINANENADLLNLDKVVFIPAASPPHKNKKKQMIAHRLTMAMLGIVQNPRFEVSDYEITKGGISYSIDTIRHFKEAENSKNKYYFMMGSDAFLEIGEWKEAPHHFKECNFVISERSGCSVTIIMDMLKQKITERFGSPLFAISKAGKSITEISVSDSRYKIYLTKATRIDISSTEIRERISQGKSIKYLVPESVLKYIKDEGIYKMDLINL